MLRGKKMEWYHVLKLARLNKGLSLRQAAQKADLSNPYISQLENGHVTEPSFFKMLRLLSLYNLTVRDMGNAI